MKGLWLALAIVLMYLAATGRAAAMLKAIRGTA